MVTLKNLIDSNGESFVHALSFKERILTFLLTVVGRVHQAQNNPKRNLVVLVDVM